MKVIKERTCTVFWRADICVLSPCDVSQIADQADHTAMQTKAELSGYHFMPEVGLQRPMGIVPSHLSGRTRRSRRHLLDFG